MDDYKLINSNYNKETGISTATIATKEGIFTGRSKLAECDRDIESSFSGCEYAEIKARIKYLKYKRKLIKNNIKCFTDFYNSIVQANKFNKDSFEARRIRRQIYKLTTQLNSITSLLNLNQNAFPDFVKQRAEMTRKIRQGKND